MLTTVNNILTTVTNVLATVTIILATVTSILLREFLATAAPYLLRLPCYIQCAA